MAPKRRKVASMSLQLTEVTRPLQRRKKQQQANTLASLARSGVTSGSGASNTQRVNQLGKHSHKNACQEGVGGNMPLHNVHSMHCGIHVISKGPARLYGKLWVRGLQAASAGSCTCGLAQCAALLLLLHTSSLPEHTQQLKQVRACYGRSTVKEAQVHGQQCPGTHMLTQSGRNKVIAHHKSVSVHRKVGQRHCTCRAGTSAVAASRAHCQMQQLPPPTNQL